MKKNLIIQDTVRDTHIWIKEKTNYEYFNRYNLPQNVSFYWSNLKDVHSIYMYYEKLPGLTAKFLNLNQGYGHDTWARLGSKR